MLSLPTSFEPSSSAHCPLYIYILYLVKRKIRKTIAQIRLKIEGHGIENALALALI